MPAFPWPGIIPAALCAAAFAAAAQPAAPARKPDPLDSGAAVPAPVYESAFKHYRRWTDTSAVPWREANDLAERIGGWRAYAREAQQPETTSAAPSAPAGQRKP